MNKPIIHSGTDISWYCECGWRMRACEYPIDLTKETIEIICDNTMACRFGGKVVAVKLQHREVLYIVDK